MTTAALTRSTLRRTLYGPSSSLLRLTARHASTDSTQYKPGGPIIQGTVNDALPYPAPSRTAGSHHWAFERLLSASLIPLTGASIAAGATPYPVLDGLLGVALVVHSHLGFEQILLDYVHKRKFPLIGPVAKWTLRVATAGALVGVYQFNTNDIGLTELIRQLWHA